ncbi:MAG: hypothetical protein JSV32_00130 [Dehalococcoidia bacterium]|nr:MAG: hypothetical protein JSV32_00130 [Dehalococcoidia bacterium]
MNKRKDEDNNIGSDTVPVQALVLSMQQIKSLISYKEALDVVEDVFKEYGKGQIVNPDKTPMYTDSPDNKNYLIGMPGFIKKLQVGGIKWLSAYFNQQPGIPAVWGSIVILNHAENGQPFTIMDGTIITEVRTAAHSAVAAKYLAKHNSEVVAMVGCGVEARSHLAALYEIFPIKLVKTYDVRPEAMATYKSEMEAMYEVRVIPTKSVKEAVKEVDIVCAVTTAQEPVIFESWIPTGCFVAGLTGFADVDPRLSESVDKWVLGHRQSDEHLGKIFFGDVADYSKVYADMGEIVTGAKPGREGLEERIFYLHLGMGVHDIALAHHIYNKALKQGIGIKIKLI